MNNAINAFLLSFSLALLVACSSTPLQTSRLDTAESEIIQAEQILARSSGIRGMKAADDKLGAASSYLATVLDNKKYLNKNQLQRYAALKRRLDAVYQQIDY